MQALRGQGSTDRLGRFCRDVRGGIAIMFALLSFVLVLLAGAAVDMAFAVQLRSSLQSAADRAALAGAAVYVDASASRSGRATAMDLMNANLPGLPANAGVAFDTAAFATVSGGATTAYNVRVTATGRLKTTFLALVTDSLTVSVVSLATVPVAGGAAEEDTSHAWRDLDLEAVGGIARGIHLAQ